MARKRRKTEKQEKKKEPKKETAKAEKQEKKPKKETADGEDKSTTRKYIKQTMIVVIIMILLLASVFIAYWLTQESKEFEYKGLSFYKEKEDTILFYKSVFVFVAANGENTQAMLKLRNDPRVLDNIPIEGTIRLKNVVVLSVSPEITNCSDTYRTIVNFAWTLGGFGIRNVSAATTDKKYSREYKIPLVDCKNAKEKTVIVMEEGNETKIVQDENCYILEIKNCEIQEVFESFILDFIVNARKESF